MSELVVPRKREKTGWPSYRTLICEPSEAESFLLLHRQANGHWITVGERDSWDEAQGEAKRMAFLNHAPVQEVAEIPIHELPPMPDLKGSGEPPGSNCRLNPMFQVEQIDDTTFRVRIAEGRTTERRVTLDPDYYLHVTGGRISPKQLVEMSLAFLLEREPNTSILPQFTLDVIERYFPEYVDGIQGRIAD